MKKISSVDNNIITITMEHANRCNKIIVWGKNFKTNKSFERYFETLEKASKYYSRKLAEAAKIYAANC